MKKNRYIVVDVPGFNLSARPLNTIMSPDKLKPWIRVGGERAGSDSPVAVSDDDPACN